MAIIRDDGFYYCVACDKRKNTILVATSGTELWHRNIEEGTFEFDGDCDYELVDLDCPDCGCPLSHFDTDDELEEFKNELEEYDNKYAE